MFHEASTDTPPAPELDGAVLAIDTGSPVVSVAIAVEREILAEEAAAVEQSSSSLLEMIDNALQRAGLRARELTALVGLRGPGSFTGLRVGLATLHGMHQALEIPAATLPTLQVLASLATSGGGTVVACVDALRGYWLAQRFRSQWPPRSLDDPRLIGAAEFMDRSVGEIVGFGVSRLQTENAAGGNSILVEPGPLAGQALRLSCTDAADWSVESLTTPLYLRSPAVVPPLRPAR